MRRGMWLLVIAGLVGTTASAQSERVVAYEIVNGREIPANLTGAIADSEAGRALYFDRELTGCSGCHGSPGGPGAQPDTKDQVAPSLEGLASRMSEGAMRIWLVAPEVLNPETAMPSYYQVGQRTDPKDPRFGEPSLSAQEIENLIAYLKRQK